MNQELRRCVATAAAAAAAEYTILWCGWITHGVVGIFDESVNRKQRQVGLSLGVVDEIEIDQFLQLEVVCGSGRRVKLS
eukprot:scaffold3595_cov235-Ochromonas_danica.AAC.17